MCSNKTENLSPSVFNLTKGINESKALRKRMSCECKCRFDGRKCNSDQWRNNTKCLYECKERLVCEKDYVWNPPTCNYENKKYLASIMDDSAIICDEVIDADADAELNDQTNFNEKKATCKMQSFYILLASLSITVALLIAVNIYCHLIKYRAKQLLPFHYRNNELREVLY